MISLKTTCIFPLIFAKTSKVAFLGENVIYANLQFSFVLSVMAIQLPLSPQNRNNKISGTQLLQYTFISEVN